MKAPPPTLKAETTLDGFTLTAPVSQSNHPVIHALLIFSLLGSLIGGAWFVIEAGERVERMFSGVKEVAGVLAVMAGGFAAALLLTGGLMRLFDRWLARKDEVLALQGATLTLTREGQTHRIPLAEVLFIDEDDHTLTLVQRGGARTAIGRGMDDEGRAWVRDALRGVMAPDSGSPDDIPAAVRAMQVRRQPQG